MKQYNVGIIGATGMVGQRFVALLEHHPWFEVTGDFEIRWIMLFLISAEAYKESATSKGKDLLLILEKSSGVSEGLKVL